MVYKAGQVTPAIQSVWWVLKMIAGDVLSTEIVNKYIHLQFLYLPEVCHFYVSSILNGLPFTLA